MSDRGKRTIEVWDRCECGRVLMSIHEGVTGTCSSCWFKKMPVDTKQSLKNVIAAAFRPADEAEKDGLVGAVLSKLDRDRRTR